MRRRIFPRARVCGMFFLVYETRGCQSAVNFLCRYYRIPKMKIILDGRRARKCSAMYYYGSKKAYFKKRALKKLIVLHELFHYVAESYELNQSRSEEERMARYYARYVLRKARASFA